MKFINVPCVMVAVFMGLCRNVSSAERPLKAIVVGASTGIGCETAKVLASHGYEVGLCSRKIDLLNQLQQTIPTKTYVKQIDLFEIDTVHYKLQEFVDEMGGLDLIVVNSGIWPEAQGGILPEDKKIPFDWVHDTIKVNVVGCTAAFNFAANYFLQQNYGHMVGISSLDTVRGSATGPVYCASKSFMTTFLEGMRNKFSQLNIPIQVTEIRPGCIQTKEEQVEEQAEVAAKVYWVVSSQVAARDIYDAIIRQDKVVYTPQRWAFIAFLLKIVPDWIYNWMGGF